MPQPGGSWMSISGGMAAMTHAGAAVMRQQGSGRIVNLSSVAAPAAIPFQTYYSVSKAAINDFTLATANEVRPFGITVCAVMPGDIAPALPMPGKKFRRAMKFMAAASAAPSPGWKRMSAPAWRREAAGGLSARSRCARPISHCIPSALSIAAACCCSSCSRRGFPIGLLKTLAK